MNHMNDKEQSYFKYGERARAIAIELAAITTIMCHLDIYIYIYKFIYIMYTSDISFVTADRLVGRTTI